MTRKLEIMDRLWNLPIPLADLVLIYAEDGGYGQHDQQAHPKDHREKTGNPGNQYDDGSDTKKARKIINYDN